MTGGGPVLLRTAMGGGHAGAPGRFDRLDEIARIYAFAIAVVEGPTFDAMRQNAASAARISRAAAGSQVPGCQDRLTKVHM